MFCRISGKERSPQIGLARLADGAGGRIGPERLVVGAAIVIAGEAEAAGRPQDQHGAGDPEGIQAGLAPNQECGSPKSSGE